MSMRGMGYKPPKMNIKTPKVSKSTKDMAKLPKAPKSPKIVGPKTRSPKGDLM